MRLRRLVSQMRLRDVLGCIFVVGFALYAIHTLFWIIDDIRLKVRTVNFASCLVGVLIQAVTFMK
jgi:uncharacterized membrane protein YciS (DUF1049 family)